MNKSVIAFFVWVLISSACCGLIGKNEIDDPVEVPVVEEPAAEKPLAEEPFEEVSQEDIAPTPGIAALSAHPYKEYQTDDSVWGLAWSPNNEFLLMEKYGESATVWAVEYGNIWPPINDNGTLIQAHSGSWSPDGRFFAVQSRWNFYIMDAMAEETLYTYESGSFIDDVIWSPDSNSLATVVDGTMLLIYNSNNFDITHKIDEFKDISYISWSPDGRLLAIQANSGLNIYDIETDETIVIYDFLLSPAWSSDSKFIAGHFWDALTILNVSSGEKYSVATPGYHGAGPRQIAWSADGKYIASAHEDMNVRLWRADDLEDYIVLNGLSNEAISVSFSADSRYLAAGDDSGFVIIWEIEQTQSNTATSTIIAKTSISESDGMVLVYVPEGEFAMGSNEYAIEQPIHTVYLDTFWIDRTEVTNEMFAAFLNDQGNQSEGGATWLDAGDGDERIHQSGGSWNADSGYADHPVVEVNWYGASNYCEWVGRRLPTEAEWEKAARGTDGRIYPWGNVFDCSKGNFDDETIEDDYVVPGGAGCDGYNRTSPVGSFENDESPYGAYDMAGNVWEWVADWYDSGYYDNSPFSNPGGPPSGDNRVLRGGSWNFSDSNSRSAGRVQGNPDVTGYVGGFRCATSD